MTDLFPKTTSFLTTINIIKAFVGLGVLAAPSGYQMVGFVPATVMIIIFGFVNTYTVHLQTMIREHYGTKEVKTYCDMGEAAYGQRGRIAFSLTIIVNQILTCTGYVKFFIDQIDELLRNLERAALQEAPG